MTTKTELQNKVKELQAQIDAMSDDKPNGRWKPETGESYFYSGSCGFACIGVWDSNLIDERRPAIGNCFKTEEAAEKHIENLKVHYELMDLADFQPDWDDRGQHKYSLVWAHPRNICEASCVIYYQSPKTVYFRTSADALDAAWKVGEKRVEMYLKGE